MNALSVLFWTLATAAGLGGLYGLHRLALRLEDRGYLYYRHKKPSGGGGAAGCFAAFQQALEPRVAHVITVSRVNHLHGEEGASGQGGADDTDPPCSDVERVSDND